MLSYKSLSSEDLEYISRFPQTVEELFYMSPKFNYPLTAEQISRIAETRQSPTVIIDTASNEPVAYSNLFDINQVDLSCWLGNVIVSPEYRGKGAAEYMIDTMAHKAKNEYGCNKLKLWCHNTNTRALIFYSKQGFRPCGSDIVLNKDEKKLVAIEMEKLLN